MTAGCVLILAAAAALLCGNSVIGAGDVLRTLAGNGTRAQQVIVFQVRLPRIAAALLSGAALSVSGYLLQNNLNNGPQSRRFLKERIFVRSRQKRSQYLSYWRGF